MSREHEKTTVSLPMEMPLKISTCHSLKQFVFVFLLSIILLPLLTACSLFHAKKDSKFLPNASILVGRVSTKHTSKSPIIVVAYSKKRGETKIAHYTCLHEPGYFELMVPKGKYRLFAFEDSNGDMIYDKDEPAGQFGKPDTVSAPAGGIVLNLDFPMTDCDTSNIDFPIGLQLTEKMPEKIHSTLAGAIADLDDEIFSQEYGSRGYWAGVDFFREVGGNVYFLEKYDPAKIPVLFVHGAKGSPQDWRYFFEHIDRSRYQPWFFYYPSGASLKTMATLLYHKLWDLQRRYRFERLYVTAHSMGSLIVRSMLVEQSYFNPHIKLFVSLSTPWGGEKLAEFGVKHSPVVVTSWQDMQPGGEFIESLFRTKLPPEIDYYLLFGFRHGINPLLPNGDGTVTMASMLDVRAQSEAKITHGFNEDHTGILSSPDVMKLYNSILDSADKEHASSTSRRGGKLKVSFSFYTTDKDLRPQFLQLQLSPASRNADKKILLLYSDDREREFGPFAAGTYTARILAPAFRTEPAQQTVKMEQGKVLRLKFSLKPQGVLDGYIAARTNHGTYTAGAWPGKNTAVTSVTLSGNGIRRTLVPSKDEKFDYFDVFTSGRDFCRDGWFSFSGLPEGEYTVIVSAEGYDSHTSIHNVSPGKPGVLQPIVLQPE